MTLFVMEKDQRTVSKNRAEPPDESAKKQGFTVNWLSVPSNIEGARCCERCVPQASHPFGEGISEDVRSICLCELGEKPRVFQLPVVCHIAIGWSNAVFCGIAQPINPRPQSYVCFERTNLKLHKSCFSGSSSFSCGWF